MLCSDPLELLLLDSAKFGSTAIRVLTAAACRLVNTNFSTFFCFCFFFSLRSSALNSAFHPDVAFVPGFCVNFVLELRGLTLFCVDVVELFLDVVELFRILLVSLPS